MRPPLEYGDNFPVLPTGSWNPNVPWRFPHHGVHSASPVHSTNRVFPWFIVAIGIMMAVVWISWHVGTLGKERSGGEFKKAASQTLNAPASLKGKAPVILKAKSRFA